MPLQEAYFWVGLTVFGTGLYFLVERASKRFRWLAWLVLAVGVLAVGYSMIARYVSIFPAIPLWLYMVVMTWALIGFDYYERHSKPPKEKLVIHRAVYAAGLTTEVSVIDELQNAVRDALVIPVDSTLGGLLPHDPAFNVRKRLDVDYSYGSDARFHVSRLEPPPGEVARLVLPEDSEARQADPAAQDLVQIAKRRCRKDHGENTKDSAAYRISFPARIRPSH